MDGSIAFARFRQYAPPSASAPSRFCPLLSRFEHIDRGHGAILLVIELASSMKDKDDVWASAVRHLGFLKSNFCPSQGLRG